MANLKLYSQGNFVMILLLHLDGLIELLYLHFIICVLTGPIYKILIIIGLKTTFA